MDEETDQQQNDDNNNDSSPCHLPRYLPRFASFQKIVHARNPTLSHTLLRRVQSV
jgi:hypothetical protein